MEGFVAAYDLDAVPAALRATVETVLRQRLAAHEHPAAVADALEAVPRSRPFEDIAQLQAIDVPTIVVASRDEADPGHPLAVGERYAQAIPQAQLLVEDAGPPPHSPLAWQGGPAVARRSTRSPRAHACVITYSCMPDQQWDGASYDRISGIQQGWGAEVLARLRAARRRDGPRRRLRLGSHQRD